MVRIRLFDFSVHYFYTYTRMKTLCLVFCVLGLLIFNSGCSSLKGLKDNPSAEELFQHARRLQERSYYKEALSHFKQLKSRFLYSRLIREADMAIADIYFAQEEWVKAVRAYGNFSELYPRHPQNDRAVFRLALSYFHQLPFTEDRDLSLSTKALTYLNQHLKSFPKSPYRKEAKGYKREVLILLARQQWMIARFHIQQGRADSALPYIKNLKQKYSALLVKEPVVAEPEEEDVEEDGYWRSSSQLPSLEELHEVFEEAKKG